MRGKPCPFSSPPHLSLGVCIPMFPAHWCGERMGVEFPGNARTPALLFRLLTGEMTAVSCLSFPPRSSLEGQRGNSSERPRQETHCRLTGRPAVLRGPSPPWPLSPLHCRFTQENWSLTQVGMSLGQPGSGLSACEGHIQEVIWRAGRHLGFGAGHPGMAEPWAAPGF